MGQAIARIRDVIVGQILNLLILPFIMISSLIVAVKPVAAAVLFILGAMFLYILIYPVTTLYLLIFSNTFDTLIRPSVDSIITLTKILTLILGICLIIKVILQKDQSSLKNVFDNPLSVAALFFLFTQVVSIINATDYTMLIIQVIRTGSFIVLYYIIITLVTNKKILKNVLLVLLIAFMVAAWLGIYELITGVNILILRWGADLQNSSLATGTMQHRVAVSTSSNAELNEQMLRLSGVQGGPNFLSFSMIFPSVLALYFFYLYKSWAVRISMAFIFILFLINIIGSVSRGGVVALGIAIVIFWYFLRVRYKMLTTIAVAFAFLVLLLSITILMPSSVYERLSFQSDTYTVSNRIGLLKMGISMIEDHPITGIGAGNYTTVAHRYLVPEVRRSDLIIHNCFLQAWIENGILGFIAYITLYLFAARNIYVVLKESEDRFINATAVAMMATLGGYFFYANIDPMLTNERYWIFFALTVVLYNLHKATRSETTPRAA